MASFYFGLNTSRNLAEISDPIESLDNLNLNINDLNKIRGMVSNNVSQTDLKGLSGLDFDAEKVTSALESETILYDRLTTNVYDKYSYISTNIDVAGSIGAASYKYKYVDYAEPNPALKIKTADVSTSRVSSWSTLESPADDNTPIFYGGNVSVEGPIELSKLNITSTITKRDFASEVPTHRIAANINGANVYLYAMKGIPLSFNGFFRSSTPGNISAVVNRIANSTGGFINPSWVVRDTTQPSSTPNTVFRNVSTSGGDSSIVFNSTFSQSRTVDFYYPPDRITSLTVSRLNILNFPRIVLPNLNTLNMSYNDLREFPDLSGFTNLKTLNLSFNNLTRSPNTSVRTFNASVVARLPAGLTSLTLGNAFGGAITGNLSALPLTELILNASSVNDRRYTGVTPTVNSSTIITYSMSINSFTSISSSVLNSNVRNVYINNNSLNQTNISFTSPELVTLIISENSGTINLIDVNGKQKLTNYTVQYARFASAGNNIRNIFNGCSELNTISMYSTNVTGNFPQLAGCNKLSYVDLRFTNILGANTVTGLALQEDSFASCKTSLTQLYISSPNFSGTIHPNTFKGMFNISRLWINSNRNTGVSGELPSSVFSDCNALEYVWLHDNRFSGSVPSFNNSNNIRYLYAPGNLFTGSVPNINKPIFQYMYLFSNQLNQFSKLDSTALIVMHLSSNALTAIPDLSNLTRLQEIYLNNNQIQSYFAGSFVNMGQLRVLNLNNNSLTQGDIDQIIIDLYENYRRSNRRGVSVNLAGGNNSAPSRDTREFIIALNSSGWNVITK